MSEIKEINCIAIDDEPIGLQIIENFCHRSGNINVTGYNNPAEGLEAINRQKPDIIFLDISMPGMSGLELARTLGPEACIIFTTAYPEYAVEGFDLDAVDFLHKPFLYERFQKALEKALRRIDFEKNARRQQTIIVKQEYDSIPIQVDQILYIEAMENYVKIYRDNGSCVVSRINMKGIIGMLPEGEFMRIHRSYIVARAKINGFTKRKVILSSGVELPVGRLYGEELKKHLG